MKSILEIPVITADNAIRDSLFKDEKKTYQGFEFLEYEIDDRRSIYFYFLNNIPQAGDEMFLDQIIPKAAFSFVIVDPLEDIKQSGTAELCKEYFDKFETPLIFLVLTNDQELKNNLVNEPLIAESNSPIVLTDPAQNDALNSALKEAFQHIIPETT